MPAYKVMKLEGGAVADSGKTIHLSFSVEKAEPVTLAFDVAQLQSTLNDAHGLLTEARTEASRVKKK